MNTKMYGINIISEQNLINSIIKLNIEIKKKYEIYINRKCNRHSISFSSR